jgi:hypothetical protein
MPWWKGRVEVEVEASEATTASVLGLNLRLLLGFWVPKLENPIAAAMALAVSSVSSIFKDNLGKQQADYIEIVKRYMSTMMPGDGIDGVGLQDEVLEMGTTKM